jgi:hypothetical protein
VDEPGVYGAGAEQPVSSGAGQPPAELLDGDQEVTGFGDGVDAQVRARSVGCAAQDVDLGPGEPLVGERHLQIARLRDDGRVRRELLQHLGGAGAGVFLVGDAGQDDVAAQWPAPDGVRGGGHHGGDAALHVGGAPAEDLPVLDARKQRIAVVGAVGDGVQVAVEHEGTAAAGAAGDGDERGAAGPSFQAVDLETALAQPGFAVVGDGRFSSARGGETGVDGVDGDEALQQRDELGTCGVGHCGLLASGRDAVGMSSRSNGSTMPAALSGAHSFASPVRFCPVVKSQRPARTPAFGWRPSRAPAAGGSGSAARRGGAAGRRSVGAAAGAGGVACVPADGEVLTGGGA